MFIPIQLGIISYGLMVMYRSNSGREILRKSMINTKMVSVIFTDILILVFVKSFTMEKGENIFIGNNGWVTWTMVVLSLLLFLYEYTMTHKISKDTFELLKEQGSIEKDALLYNHEDPLAAIHYPPYEADLILKLIHGDGKSNKD